RTGMRTAAEQIEDATTAITTFGGGYGPRLGLENGALSTKEKIALAMEVGRSRRLKQVATLCGRLTRIALHVQSTRVQYPPDEVANIKYGSDISHVLPSELALLADPALEDLFFHRYAEGQLMQYELLGNEKQGQGPIILAVDTSGSMTESLGGVSKDVWAKAVMLALMAIARLQERDMVAFLFSGSAHELTRFDFPKGRAPHQTVIKAVETFYNGGTVFEPWMEAALQTVDETHFNRADVIVATDGLTSISAAARDAWQQRRAERGMRAYGILLGTREGMHALAQVADAVLTIDNLGDDMPILQTIFAI
ncbi:MAG: VWA domain-containing protein, partial [Roseiflexaceae bacterium]